MKKNNFIFLITFVVFLGLAGFVAADITIPNPLAGGGVTDFPTLITKITEYVTTIIASLTVLVLVWAGILFVTSGGNEARLTKAKHALTYAVIGAAIALAATGLIAVIKAVVGPPPG